MTHRPNAIHTASGVLLSVLVGCSHGTSVAPPSTADVPESVAIRPTTVTSGVQIGPARRQDAVEAFRIAKYPTTSAQYADCVKAGACSTAATDACNDPMARPPFERPTVSVEHGDRLPATCVGVTQARAFCEWVGGRLPTLKEFMLAARGPAVARFPWGNNPASCDQRPDGAPSPLSMPGKPCSAASDPLQNFAIGKHPAGASPLGVEDVLMAPGELIDVSSDAQTSACGPPFAACVAHGVLPGAIDGFEPLSADSASQRSYQFRCAWN
jgi:hypothetical protein